MLDLRRVACAGALLLAVPSAAHATIFRIDQIKLRSGDRYQLVGGFLKQDVSFSATYNSEDESGCWGTHDTHMGATNVDYVAEKQRDVLDVTRASLKFRHPLLYSGDITRSFSRNQTADPLLEDMTGCPGPPTPAPISTSSCGTRQAEKLTSITLMALGKGSLGPFGTFEDSGSNDIFGTDCPSDDQYGVLAVNAPDLTAKKAGADKVRLTGSATDLSSDVVGDVGSPPDPVNQTAKITWAIVLKKQG